MKKAKNVIVVAIVILTALFIMIIINTIKSASYDRVQKIKQYNELYASIAALKISKQSDIKNNFNSLVKKYVEGGKYSQNFIDKKIPNDIEKVTKKCMSEILGERNDLPDNVAKINDESLKKLLDIASKNVSSLESINESTCEDLYKQQLDSYKEDYDKEMALRRQQEEINRKYEANHLSLDKFNNQIKSGMSLNSIKNIFLFDNYCELSTESNIAGYSSQIYTCKDFGGGIAVFQFQNGKLITKSQVNLK